MKLVDFDRHTNQWFMSVGIEGQETRAYLGIHFEDNHKEAYQKALKIKDTLTNHYEKSLQEIPMGTMDDFSEDFRCMVANF